jgi:ABC-type multidrug transport system ATPase subunit
VPTALHVDGLVVHASDGSLLLDEVSFSVPRGSLVAVVGPTGAGKTTLLNAITGSIEIDAGTITVEGVDRSEARRGVGYVPQDDALHPQLDLNRTLGYSATLRLPTLTDTERAGRVDAVVNELGLGGQVRLPVSCLSGGQRKRASVAVELLAGSDVLVLDEPTSGLDPWYEKSLLETLRTLANNGRTVLTVTHSLKALAGCDLALFLAPGGRVAFFGPPEEARVYFGGDDPADVFLALDAVPGEQWKARFQKERPPVDLDLTGPHPKAAPKRKTLSWPAQFATLARRYLDLIRSDRRQLTMLLVQGPVLGLLLWLVLTPGGLRRAAMSNPSTSANAVTAAVFVAISATWLGAANSVREIVKEQRVLRREQGRGLSVGAYVGSKAAILGAFSMLEAAILVAVATVRQDVPARGAVLPSGAAELMVGAALTALAAVALGLLISAVVNSPDKAMSVLPMILVSQLVLSGGWASVLHRPGIHQVADLTAARWGVSAFQATAHGDATSWWSAVFALIALTIASLVAVDMLVRRRLRLEGLQVKRVALPVAVAGIIALAMTLHPFAGPSRLAAASTAATSAAAAKPVTNPAPNLLALAAPAPSKPATPPTTAAPRATATTHPPVHSATPPTTTSNPVKAVVGAVANIAAPVTQVVAKTVTQTVGQADHVVSQLASPPTTQAAPPVTTATAPTQLSMADLINWWMSFLPPYVR